MRGKIRLAMIAAVGASRELGRDGDLVWHIPADLKNFKRLTTGHPVIMGRKTWESLPKRPLPGRTNVVISRSLRDAEGAIVVNSVEQALNVCAEEDFPFVIGGAEIYRTFLPASDQLYLTRIEADAGEGVDAWFPEYEQEWILSETSEWAEEKDGVRYRFEIWRRRED